jgi:UDP-3-O-[3-hydroxymyristoyl] glucosamine N-acyltransferase
MIPASEIAAFLREPLHGPDVQIERPRPLSDPLPHSLLFVKSYHPKWVPVLNSASDSLVIAAKEYEGRLEHTHILVSKPRLALARILQRFFQPEENTGIDATAVVAPSASLAEGVSVGPYSVIGPGVQIGAGTVVRNHVVISGSARIGCRCLVKSHAVIGEEGFGMEFDEADMPVRVPHIGGVVIGNDVEVGAFCAIARGTLGDTRIGDFVKLDDHTHVAHNVTIHDGAILTAGAVVSGSVTIGRRAWVGPNAAINNKLSVAENSLVGIGAAVMWSAKAGEHIVGNPGRPLWKSAKPHSL